MRSLRGLNRSTHAYALDVAQCIVADRSERRLEALLVVDQVGSSRQLAALGDIRAATFHKTLLGLVHDGVEQLEGRVIVMTGDAVQAHLPRR